MVVGGTIFEDSVGPVRATQEIGYQPDAAFFTTGPSLPTFGEALGDAANGVFAAGWGRSTLAAGCRPPRVMATRPPEPRDAPRRRAGRPTPHDTSDTRG